MQSQNLLINIRNMNEKELLIKNEKLYFSVRDNHEKKEMFSKLAKCQSPHTLVICCSDSRVIPEEIFSSTFGELFVIRTAGNVINDGELGSLEYGIEHLHIDLVVVLGHSHCGAVHASVHHEQGKYLSPILSRIQKNIGLIQDELLASKTNAIKEAQYIKEKFPSYKGTVVAMFYDIETGMVEIIK